MIKDGKFISTEFPHYEIHWGLLQNADEIKIKEWLTENITNLCTNVMLNIKDTALCHSYVDALVRDIYDNIHQVGYDEGYDLIHCEKFPISFEFSRKEDRSNFFDRLVAAHDFKIVMDPDDIMTSHLSCYKCGLHFRYDGYKMLSFSKDVHSFDELLECKE